MGGITKTGFFLVLLIVLAEFSHAQFSGNNLMEYQYGKLPDDTASISTLYDRAVVNYNYRFLKNSATLEQFNTPMDGSNYVKLSQFSLQYKLSPIEIKIGNFYETLGRGILLRSFEIPGAILEDLSYRSRHYFNRDILGISGKFHHKNFTTKVLYGSPLNYVFPPTQDRENRRADTIAAIYAEYSIKQQTFAASTMYHTNSGTSEVYGMLSASGNISQNFSYYTEMAKNLSDYDISDFSGQSSHAFYGSLNLVVNNFGISAEYKNYNNFLIGSGINEPPALVKEHTYKVLNRSTHVLQPANETGYQFEMFYTFDDLSTLTANNTLAVNDFGEVYRFREYFLEYDFMLAETHDMKIFTDYAEDPFKLEEHRISAGAYMEWKVFKNSSLKTDYEFQTFDRLVESYQNHVLVLGYSYKSKLIFNIVSEYSNDSFIVEEGFRTWFGANVKYQVNNGNSLQLFAGERRGGPACNAGVCYEVLDFSGIELRFSSRF
jgi:hypothetical protein